MAVTTVNQPKNEGLSTFDIIKELDNSTPLFEDNQLPFSFNQETYDSHKYLFDALNERVKKHDSDATLIDNTTEIAELQDVDKVKYFDRYRSILSEASEDLTFFNILSPHHKKRIIDANAMEMANVTNAIYKNMPPQLEKEEVKDVLGMYNQYFKRAWLPSALNNIDEYSRTHSKDDAGNNLKRAFNERMSMLLEGVAVAREDMDSLTPWKDDPEATKWWAEQAKKWSDKNKTLEDPTGLYALTDDQVKEDAGTGWIRGMPTTKSGYAYNRIAEDLIGQSVNSFLPIATSTIGASVGSGGGPIGTVVGFTSGLLSGLAPGFFVETGAFSQEMKELWRSSREQAKYVKSTGKYTDEEFFNRYKINIGQEDGNDVFITADKLTDVKIDDIVNNLALSYAATATAMEGVSSGLSVMTGGLTKLGFARLSAMFAGTKIGQRAIANSMFNKVLKPLKHFAGITKEMAQEGLTEYYQEDLNMAMMEPYLPDYQKQYANRKERLESAMFMGAVSGGTIYTGGTVVSESYGAYKNRGKIRDNSWLESVDKTDRYAKEIEAKLLDKDNKNSLFIDEVDLAVQIAIGAGGGSYENPFVENVKKVTDDNTLIGAMFRVRGKYPANTQNSENLVNLLQTKQAKKVMAKMGLNATHFTGTDNKPLALTREQMLRVFGTTQLKKLGVDLTIEKAETDSDLGDYDNPETDVHESSEDAPVKYDNDEVIDNELSKKIEEFNEITNTISKARRSKKKVGQLMLDKHEKLKQEILNLRGGKNTRQKIRDNQKNLDKVSEVTNENDPVNIIRLKEDSLVGKDKNKTAYINDKKQGVAIAGKVVSKSVEVNPKTKQKETVYLVEPYATQPTSKPSGGRFKVFTSEIDIANDGKKRWSPPKNQVMQNIVELFDAPIETQEKSSKELFQSITNKNEDASNLSKIISTKGTTTGFRDLATFLTDKAKGIKTRFDKRIKASANYNPDTNTITINPDRMENLEMFEGTVLHETIHGITSNIINDYNNDKLDTDTEIYKNIKKIDTLFNIFKESLSTTDKKGLIELETFISRSKKAGLKSLSANELKVAQELRQRLYGFKNVKEFVAEVLVNKELQNTLDQIQIEPNKGFFQFIKEMIADYIGINPNDPQKMSQLSQALTRDFIEQSAKGVPQKKSDKVEKARDDLESAGAIINIMQSVNPEERLLRVVDKNFDTPADAINDLKRLKENQFIENDMGGMLDSAIDIIRKKVAESAVQEYSNLDKRVQFPLANKREDQKAIVDGKEIELTQDELDQFEVLIKNQNAGGNLAEISKSMGTRNLAMEIVKRVENKIGTKKAPPIPSRGAKAISGQPPIEEMFTGEDESIVFDDNSEIYLANNALESLTNEDYLSDPNVDESPLINWGRNKGLLGPTNKKRVYRRFEYGFLSRLKQGLPINYWEHYVKSMNDALGSTVLGPHFKKWAEEYAVNLETNVNIAGVFDEGFVETVDKTFNTDLSGLAQIYQDAYDLTEEQVRQGYGLKKTGELDGNTTADNFAKIDQGFFKLIDIMVTDEMALAIDDVIQNTNNVDEFINELSSISFIEDNNFLLPNSKTLRDILQDDYNGSVTHLVNRFYISNKSRNKTKVNRETGNDVNTYFAWFFKKADKVSLFQKKEKNEVVLGPPENRQKYFPFGKNVPPSKVLSRAAERVLDNLSYLSLKDAFRLIKVSEPGDKEAVFDSTTFSWSASLFKKLIATAIDSNMIPLFVRGDGTLVPMVGITKENQTMARADEFGNGNLTTYWNRELSLVRKEHGRDAMIKVRKEWLMNYVYQYNSDNIDDFVKNKDVNKIVQYNAGQIARHEAYKKLYGDDYWVHMNMHKLVHRAKIPFGSGISNDQMPSKKMRTFDPGINLGEKSKSVMTLTMLDGTEREVPLVQKIDNQWQYIWDGMTVTSEKVHSQDYNKYLATNDKARRAKTFIYQRDGNGAFMVKHQEMTFFLPDDVKSADITDGEGNDVATIRRVNGDVTILDAEGNYLDYLNTPDENKVMTGEYAKMLNQSIDVDGGSVNLIQFPRDKDKSFGKFYKQLLNYFPDKEMQKLAKDFFEDPDPRRPRSPMQFFKKLAEVVSNPSALDRLKIQYSNATIDGLPLMLKRNAQSGVGFHVSEVGTNENVVKNGIIEPALEFPVYGTTLDFRMDTMGNLADDEIILPYDHSIADNIRKIMNAPDATKEQINRFLAKNPIEVLAIRSPVTSRYGYRVMKIKSLENIGDTFMVNPKIVKQVYEADGDGDKASITFLNNKAKPFLEALKAMQVITEGINLTPNEILIDNVNIGTLEGLSQTMAMMGYGKQSVGEIANVQKVIGIMETWFESLTVISDTGFRTIKLRKLDDVVYDERMDESHELQDIYRRYIQAGADHAKMLLLNPESWNYSREKLYSLAFYYEDDPSEVISANDYKALREMAINPITTGGAVLSGKDLSKIGNKRLTFDDYITYSEAYEDYVAMRDNMVLEKNYKDSGPVVYNLNGDTNANHALETMIISVAKHAHQNGYDGDVFRSTTNQATLFNNLAIDEHIRSWTEEMISEAEKEMNIDLSKLERAEKDAGMRKIQERFVNPRKMANEFSYQFDRAIKKRKREQGGEVAFSSNEIQFNTQAGEVIQRFLALMDQQNYTRSMKMQFTLSLLMDTTVHSMKSQRDTAKFQFPPTDPMNNKMSLLDPKIMSEYYNTWNRERLNFKNATDISQMLKDAPKHIDRTINYQKDEFQKRGCIV